MELLLKIIVETITKPEAKLASFITVVELLPKIIVKIEANPEEEVWLASDLL